MDESRRDFLRTTGLITAGTLSGWAILQACQSASDNPLKDIAIIGTINEEIKKDWRSALTQVAEIGYKYIESARIFGDDLPAYKTFLKEIDLTHIAGGLGVSEFLEDKTFAAFVQKAHDLEFKYAVTYWPWLTDALNISLDELKETADRLNKIGARCKAEGLIFTWHNHDKEFWPVAGDTIPFDYLLANTDPDLVKVEIDLYWIHKGNDEPLHYFEKYPGRFPLAHVKDMDNTEERSFECVGDGIIDFPSIFAKAELAGIKHLIVEHDRPENGMECARTSWEYLQSIL
ncbi:MAG: sugar phosphate isomerase/epimerase [Bacteroidales bacterium]|nr:sugar phosphate isomerase/epimerase [Bacteroidales bacterium]